VCVCELIAKRALRRRRLIFGLPTHIDELRDAPPGGNRLESHSPRAWPLGRALLIMFAQKADHTALPGSLACVARDQLALVDNRKKWEVRMADSTLAIAQDVKPMQTGTRLWPSCGIGCANTWAVARGRGRSSVQAWNLQSCRVIEIGARCRGLGGFSFALCGAQSVVCTDGDQQSRTLSKCCSTAF
jgi:hypothetical protein